MAVISRDLGPVTAYAAAVNRGYTGTREEFETLMASYATVAEQAGESAESAEESAASAAQSAASASQSAQNAESSKYNALLYSNQANGYKNTANTAAQAAKDARDAAQSAQTAAEAAQEGAEAAVEGFDSAVTQAISDVNAAGTNQRELAKRQAEKSEAWAVGKINGEDVGVSDPAYHNNAKYYAESAGTSATTATTKASEAAQSAANAASSAAAAEDAADRAEEAARTLTIDDTLSKPGQPADSKTVGDTLAEKLDIADVPNTVDSANQLLSEKHVVDTEPYRFRPSGGQGADREFDTIVGGSIVWNQLAKVGEIAWSTSGYRGIYVTKVDDSTVHVSGTSTDDAQARAFYTPKTKYKITGRAGHVFYISSSDSRVKVSVGSGSALQEGITKPLTIGDSSLVFKIASNVDFGESGVDVQVHLFDLTQMFGSEIADYLYGLDLAELGTGVAWFRKYFPNNHYECNPGELMHVSSVSAHKTYDADENIIGNYSLDSSLTLRGIPKLVDGHLTYDGDIYKPDGTVERQYGTRAYESGDESLSNAITDGTNTVYKLTTPTTEQAQSFQSPQVLDPYGTEEYVTTSLVPVGHETKYPENLRAKIEGLPWNFASLIAPVETEFKATQNYTSGSLFIVNNTLYKATANIANGGTITPNTNCTNTTLAEIITAL